MDSGAAPTIRVRIWDLPTRLFHWLIVALMPILWWTAEEEMMNRHRAAGYAMTALLVFRLLWGLFGSSTARFANFVTGPRAVLLYLRGRATHVLGHNPVGGLSVVAMLGLLSLETGLGLFATDEDGIAPGPLSHWVSYEAAEEIADLHEDLFNLLLALIAVHVAAILFYLFFRRDNLVKAMIVGTHDAPAGTAPMIAAPAWRFVLAAVLAAAFTWWIAGGF